MLINGRGARTSGTQRCSGCNVVGVGVGQKASGVPGEDASGPVSVLTILVTEKVHGKACESASDKVADPDLGVSCPAAKFASSQMPVEVIEVGRLTALPK